jgi:hypothetical protein
MSRKKNLVKSQRYRLDGNMPMPITNPRDQVFWDWYLDMKSKDRAAPVARELLTAILNGEMGSQMQKAIQQGDTQAAIEAAQDLINAFVIEDAASDN